MSRTVPLVSWRGSPSSVGTSHRCETYVLALHVTAGDDGEGAVRGEVVLLEDDLRREGSRGLGAGVSGGAAWAWVRAYGLARRSRARAVSPDVPCPHDHPRPPGHRVRGGRRPARRHARSSPSSRRSSAMGCPTRRTSRSPPRPRPPSGPRVPCPRPWRSTRGRLLVGLAMDELEALATAPKGSVRKVSRPNLGLAIASGEWGATTVAATMIAAQAAGIRVFATGGIGGVHRGALGGGGSHATFDISADLDELATDAGRRRVRGPQGNPGRAADPRVPGDARRAGGVRGDRRDPRVLLAAVRDPGAQPRAGHRGRGRRRPRPRCDGPDVRARRLQPGPGGRRPAARRRPGRHRAGDPRGR